jgi:allantoicase
MIPPDSASWTLVLPRTKTGPHRRHFFHLENVADQSYTHVRVTMHPDGGIKRIRVMGRRSMEPTSLTIGRARGTVPTEVIGSFDVERLSPSIVELPFEKASVSALPLTQEAFSPFGAVVQAYSNPFAVPRGMKVVDANQGSAVKFVHDFVSIDSSYPDDVEPRPTTRFAVYRASPAKEALPGKLFPVRLLERHPYNNQAFFCIGNSTHGKLWESDLEKPGRAYLVVVALSGDDGKPDLSTLRAFIASVSQGIVYGTGVWHHPLISFETVSPSFFNELRSLGGFRQWTLRVSKHRSEMGASWTARS